MVNQDKRSTGLAHWHFDYTKLGERLIHYGKFRFNRAGELVEYSGRVIKDVPCEAARALEWLRKVKPDFFGSFDNDRSGVY